MRILFLCTTKIKSNCYYICIQVFFASNLYIFYVNKIFIKQYLKNNICEAIIFI